MEAYRTEEEQVEALRRWWDENGRSTVAAIVLALGAGFGWQGWQQHQQTVAEEASGRYDELIEAVRLASDPTSLATVGLLAEQLKTDYPGTAYAQFAALHLARIAVGEGDSETAERELRWVLTAGPADEIRLLTELRLARVVADRGDPRGGLEILGAADPGAYAPAFAEAEGDMHQMLGDTDQAIAAYERAQALAAAAGVGASNELQLKLRALTPVPARESAPAAEESGEAAEQNDE